MRLIIISMLALFLLQNANAQCYSVFRYMDVQPPAIPAGYQCIDNACPYGFYYITHAKYNGAFSNAIYRIWNGSQWTSLKETVFKGGCMQLLLWNGRLIGFGKVKSIDGMSAPNGKFIRFAEYKNGQWDTLPGGTFDSTDYRQYKAYGTKTGLYYSYDSTGIGSRLGKVYYYDTNLKHFKKIIDYENPASAAIIMGGDQRLLVGAVYYLNGATTGGFCYVIGDSIKRNTKGIDPYQHNFSYGIDGSNDHIFACGIGTGLKYPPVFEFNENDSIVDYKETTDCSFGGEALVRNGLMLFQDAYPNFNMICKGEKRWRSMGINRSNSYASLYVTKYGYYILEKNTGQVQEIFPGSKIIGKAYVDVNANCQYDAGKDSAIHHHLVSASSNSFQTTTYTNQNGDYEFFVPFDSIVIKGEKNNAACSINSVIAKTKDSIYTSNLPIQKPTIYDLEIVQDYSKKIRWNSSPYYGIMLENKGLPCDSAWFELKFDPKLKLLPIQDPSITSINNNVIIGRLKNLGYFDKRYASFPIWVDSSKTKPDTIVCNTFSGYLYKNESDSTNNLFNFCQTVAYSFDPNHIQCDKDSVPPALYSTLEYRIDFQNEGKADAIDVLITDELSALLSPETIKEVSASHPYSMTIGSSSITVNFKNIHLKSKDSSEALSKGYFKFKITTNPTIIEGDSISNKANIYFDLNKPIATNTSEVLVRKIKKPNTAISSIPFQGSSLFASPNPANTIINITSPVLQDIFIYNVNGELVYSEKANGNITSINVSTWPAGLYFVRCANLSCKFIKL